MPLIKNERTVERPARPCILLPGETCVAHPHAEFNRVGINREALFERLEGPFVIPTVVELMSFFVVLLRTEETLCHRDKSSLR